MDAVMADAAEAGARGAIAQIRARIRLLEKALIKVKTWPTDKNRWIPRLTIRKLANFGLVSCAFVGETAPA